MCALTLPNALTLLRLFAAPTIPIILFREIYRWDAGFPRMAFAVATTLALTDFLDGWLAKTLRQESNFGKWIDPIADSIFCGSLFVSAFIVYLGFPLLLYAWLIFSLYFAWYGLKVTRMRWVGKISGPNREAKWAMCVLMISLLFVLIGTFATPYYAWHATAVVGVVISAILTLKALEKYERPFCTDCTCSKH